MSQVRVVETALCDGALCATGGLPATEDVARALPALDRAGYWAVDAWGGEAFGLALRERNEDPWARLEDARRGLANTRLMASLFGQALVGDRHYADDVVDAFVARAAALGVDAFRLVDPLNDVETLRRSLDAVKRAGCVAIGAIAYSRSAMHDDAFFTTVGRRLGAMGFDAVCVDDPAGELTPSATYRVVRALLDAVTVPVHVRAHDRRGAGSAVVQKAVEAGAACVHTALGPWSGAGSLPSTDAVAWMLERTPWDPGLDPACLVDGAEALGASRDGVAVRRDPQAHGDRPVPIGVVRRVVERLAEHDALDYVDDALAEAVTIRRDLGDPALIGPIARIVADQAVVHVGSGARYHTALPGVQRYCRGMFGKPPREIDAVVRASVIGAEPPIVGRPADRLAPELEAAGTGGTFDAEASLDAALLRSLALDDEARYDETRYDAAPVPAATPTRDVTVPPIERSVPASPSAESSAVFAPVGGRVSVVHVQPGQSVTRGRPLVQFDDGQSAVAPAGGKLVELLVQTGDRVVSGALIAKVEAVELV